MSGRVGSSICWNAFLATRRTPPTFTDGSVLEAIQRRTVLNETPQSRAISSARRYSRSVVTSDLLGEAVPGVQAASASDPDSGRPRAPACARGRSARRSPPAGSSQGMWGDALALPRLRRVGARSLNGQIVVSLAVRRFAAPCARGCARRPRKIPVGVARLPP